MIFDILEQEDLFDISKCRRKSTLKIWLDRNRIAYLFDAKGGIIAHKKALESSLGVNESSNPEKEVCLFLEDGDAA